MTLRSPCLAQPVDLELPGDVPLARLRLALQEALRLPAGDYVLVHHDRPLADEATLNSAGVLTGDMLDLLPAGAKGALEAQVEQGPTPPITERSDPPATAQSVVFWSGPAGGTGRTTLALALALRAAAAGLDVLLLALSEPAVSVYLRLPRAPDLGAFFQSGSLAAAVQEVSWRAADEPGAQRRARIALGRPGSLPPAERDAGQVTGLLAAARAAYSLLVIDLPAQGAGEAAWVLEPLRWADDVVLVCPPTVRGVAATVAALATLANLAAPVRVQLALARCAPAGFSAREVAAGVRDLWGSCPALAVEVPYAPGLAALIERGELLEVLCGDGAGDSWREGRRLVEAAEALAGAIGVRG